MLLIKGRSVKEKAKPKSFNLLTQLIAEWMLSALKSDNERNVSFLKKQMQENQVLRKNNTHISLFAQEH